MAKLAHASNGHPNQTLLLLKIINNNNSHHYDCFPMSSKFELLFVFVLYTCIHIVIVIPGDLVSQWAWYMNKCSLCCPAERKQDYNSLLGFR